MRYTVIGYLCKDVALDTPQGFRWGGGVLYSGLTAAQLGVNVQVITCCEPTDFVTGLHPNMNWHIQPHKHTTTFDNRYDPLTHIRQQYLPVRAGDIQVAGDLVPSSDIVHLAPLAYEIDIGKLPDFGEAWLVATPQGWMRRVDENGRISKHKWEQAPQLLPRLKALALSVEDVKGDFDLVRSYAAAGPTVLFTHGAEGSIVLDNGQEIPVRAFPPREIVDLTGAGDVIAAAFFVRYRETGDPVAAAAYGAMAATICIEHHGAEGLPSRTTLEARLLQAK
jgi:sugar/nucleoside kinase (ribokinase family)